MKIELDVKIPEGYEFVKFGIPKQGDIYLLDEERGLFHTWDNWDTCARKVIVKKKETVPILFKLVKAMYPHVSDITIKEFIETVEKVYEIDNDSGKYLIYLALFEDDRIRTEVRFSICGRLDGMFDWSCYLGLDHWNDIQSKLKYKPTVYK